ncbi:hypothetical protein [Roseicyclus sp.]|uniref:hypothetical protein n=1 Tax=Roseicyclus sp. TaxID=1914329 RepID=UPI003FA15EE8
MELLVALAEWQDFSLNELSRDEVFGLTDKGRAISDHLNENYVLPSLSQYEALGFTSDPIPGGSHAELELRSHPRIECDVLLIERQIPDRFIYFAPTMAGERWLDFLEAQIIFFDASDCVPGFRGQLSGAIIHSEAADDYFFLLPKSWLEPLPALLLPERIVGEIEFFRDETGQIEESRGAEAALFPPMDEHVFTSASALRNALARSLAEQTGGHYRGSDLQIAIDALFSQRTETANFSGITAPLVIILHVAPFFMLFILWQLHRAVNQLETLDGNEYWVTLDTRDLPGLLIATVFSLLPYLSAVMMAIAFCSAEAIWGIYFGHLVHFDERMHLIIEPAPPIGWLSGIGVFTVIVGIQWWVHILLAMEVSLNLLGIVLRSRT